MAISRSENMRRIRSKDTAPELALRRLLRSLGFTGYRIHRRDLPGKPDVAFVGRRKAIFVNGCFWHGHACSEGARVPKSNQAYWLPKIQKNRDRDTEHMTGLSAAGWGVLTLWECEMGDEAALQERLKTFMNQ